MEKRILSPDGSTFFATDCAIGGISELKQAYECAADCTQTSPIEFSIGISRLHELGLNDNHLRWLIKKSLVQHSIEFSHPPKHDRAFLEKCGLAFLPGSCFCLTDSGFTWAESVLEEIPLDQTENRRTLGNGRLRGIRLQVDDLYDPTPSQAPVPIWNAARQELKFLGKLVKKFSGPSRNQICVLNAFQEENWPDRVFDPMKPKEGVDSRRRLNDTVKGLNNKQKSKLIRFRCDGSGEGVTWEPIENPEPEQESRN